MKAIYSVLKWLVVASFGVIVAIAFYVFVIAPSLQLRSWSHSIATAMSGAQSITFIEFVPTYGASVNNAQHEIVLQRVNATPVEINAFLSATDSRIIYNDHFGMAMCFNPHHRVEVLCRDGSRFDMAICFHCNNFGISDQKAGAIPSVWLPRLRQFFTDIGMPPRTYAEYAELVDEKLKGSEPPTTK